MSDDEDLDLPKKPSMLPVIIAAVGALAVGAGAGFGGAYALGMGPGAETAEAAAPEEEPIEVERGEEVIVIDDPSAVHIHDLERFTVNLRGGGGGRTLRMAVQLQSTARHQYDLKDAHAAMRDSVLTLASDYTYGDVEGFDGKQRLKDDMLAALVKVVDPEMVDRIYFTEFQVN